MPTPVTPVFGSGNTGSGTGAIVVTLPTHQTGDLLVVQIDQNTNATFSGITTGWVALRAAQASGTALTQSLYYKVATSAAETNPSFTPSKTLTWAAGSMRFRDVDVVTNIGTPNTGTGATSGTAHSFGTLPALEQPNCIHVITLGKLAGTNESDAQLTPPTNYTEGYSGGHVANGTTIKSWCAYRNLVGPGTLTVGNATGTSSVRWVSQSFILRSTEYATYRSTGTIATGTTGSVTPAIPTGAITNDLLTLQVYVQPNTATVATPTNYTLVGSQSGASGVLYVYRRLHTTGNAAPTVTPTGATIVRAIHDAYYRVHTTTPVDGSVFADAGATTTPTTGSYSVGASNVTLSALFAAASATSGLGTPPSTMFERHDTTGLISQDQIQAATGSSGTKTTTLSSSLQTITALVGICSTTSVAPSASYKDAVTRARVRVQAFRDAVLRISVGLPQRAIVTWLALELPLARFRDAAFRIAVQSGVAAQYRDVAVRIRRAIRAYRDAAVRIRSAITAYRDSQFRIRIGQTAYRDAVARVRAAITAYRDAVVRVRVRITAYRDSQVRIRAAIQAYRDAQVRIRTFGRNFRDAVVRIRSAITAWRDSTLRARVGVRAFRDAVVRARVRIIAYRDAVARIAVEAAYVYRDAQIRARVAARAYRDAAFRVIVAIRAYRDAQVRARVAVQAYRDAVARIRVFGRAFRDSTLRIRTVGISFRDAQVRIRTFGRTFRDSTARIVVIAVGLAYKEAGLRVRIAVRNFKDSSARIAVGIRGYRDAAFRVATRILGYRDAVARIRTSALAFRDATVRIATKLAGQGYRDAQVRIRAAVRTYRDATARLRVGIRRFNDAAFRVYVGILRLRDAQFRARIAARAYRDAVVRVTAAIRNFKDAALRVYVSVQGYRDGSVRIRAAARSFADAVLRIRVTSLVPPLRPPVGATFATANQISFTFGTANQSTITIGNSGLSYAEVP